MASRARGKQRAAATHARRIVTVFTLLGRDLSPDPERFIAQCRWLLKTYHTAIAGMKHRAGDWRNTKTLLDAFAKDGFDVFLGSESFLLAGLRNGAVGCISAIANVSPAAIDKLYREWQQPDADPQQVELNAVRKTVGQQVMIPALKQVVTYYADDWKCETVRPPLVDLTAEQAKNVIDGLKRLDFTTTGLGRSATRAAA